MALIFVMLVIGLAMVAIGPAAFMLSSSGWSPGKIFAMTTAIVGLIIVMISTTALTYISIIEHLRGLG